MRRRTQAREFAMQILYSMDITHDDCAACLDNFWQGQLDESIEASIKEFTGNIVHGVAMNLKALDEKISQYATNWQLSRMAVVDRNILRMGAFELIFCPDIPPKVSINEAVDLAKRYSGPEAGKFVNAILDKIKQELKR
jgi:transcription antitermination factor NusB